MTFYRIWRKNGWAGAPLDPRLCPSLIKWHDRQKWNESGFKTPLCTYRLNWAMRTSWGWWDEWDDTVLQTQDSKFKPWRSEVEHATSRSRRLPTILSFTRRWGRNIFVSFKPPRPGTDSGVKGSSANHYPRAPAWQTGNLSAECAESDLRTLRSMSDINIWGDGQLDRLNNAPAANWWGGGALLVGGPGPGPHAPPPPLGSGPAWTSRAISSMVIQIILCFPL